MKKLFLSNMGLSHLHFGSELELVTQAIQEGDEVFVIKCDNQLNSCYFNPCHNLLGCAICSARTDYFHQSINIPKENIFPLYPIITKDNFSVPAFKSLKELINYEFEGYNIGRGVASSVISLERNYSILNNSRQLELIQVQFIMAVNALLNYKKVIEGIKPDCVYLFNGRFAEQFALVTYCQKEKIPFITYESASSDFKYQLFKNKLPHSMIARKEIMATLWEEGEKKEHIQVARKWFESKRKGTNTDDKNYLEKQQKNSLPVNFDTQKRNIAIFNSSEDEMKAIGEWETSLYSYQNEAIFKIVNFFAEKYPTIHFYLRMHPNLGKLNNQQTKELYAFKSKNFTLILPNNPVDSIALVEACEKTITFGSTIGIEATYWKRPSILFGKSFYDELDCVFIPKSYQNLFKLIEEEELLPKPQDNCHKYGYFMKTYGTPYQLFNNKGKFESTFNGKVLKRITFKTILKLLKYVNRFSLWRYLNQIILDRKLSFKDLFLLKSHTIEK